LIDAAVSPSSPRGRQVSCLIDSCIALLFSRSPLVVFEVIGQLWQLFVRAFMIAAERNRWTSLSPKRGLTLYKPDEIVRGMADRDEERRDQAQRNSVSFSQSEWSNAASLRATAVLARLGPLASAIFLPHA
jgi:hypothetical protein